MRQGTVLVAISMTLAAVLAAQGGPPPVPITPPPGLGRTDANDPVFRSGTTVVQIDAIVTGADGRPVTGLTREDFEVREARQVRRISTFSEVNIPIGPPVGL